ncbi:hypothetical protein B7R21_09830 [Subtercola boreus]|uniref:Uncharacterized protein n=1 Tax=Subtercola boreus TaxID=120213 RepID=A0A3E0VRY0_9MICO|nr:hypothetical protein [Subtercola boreus]RFA12636.1 hypothetical protein B7R21_09830 [Subtercola boreus]
MDLFDIAYDALPPERDTQTVEQKIARANVLAILSVSQHLSRINEGESTFSESIVDLARHFAPAAGKTDWHR